MKRRKGVVFFVDCAQAFQPAPQGHHISGTFDEVSVESSASSSVTGIWYLPSSQRPRSISLHRSLQKGKKDRTFSAPACGSSTGFLQIGQRKAIAGLYAAAGLICLLLWSRFRFGLGPRL